ncbi:MAG: ATP-binding cassette domain-containing protein, partial [Clostridia bacterium]|nr:ATP-binding cassette domain-containing protein [Clostridia bacterium]
MIQIENLVKKYGDKTAVGGITFSVEEGEIVGFLGPNGAGKTTTMSIITGCLSATSGKALINGIDILENPIEAKRQSKKMIYHLFELLKDYDIPGQGLLHYLSFRAIVAFTTALLISIIAGKRIIRWIQRKQIGEEIRDLGLEGQMQKKGTPTMGGIIIFLSIIIPVLLFARLDNIYIFLLLISTIWFFLIGFADDYIKVFRKNKEGMSPKMKLAAQTLLGLAIGLTVCFSDQIVVREEVAVEHGVEKHDMVKSTKTTIP